MSDRREFMKFVLAGGAAALAARGLPPALATADSIRPSSGPDSEARDAWAQLPAILKRIQPPVFPQRDFDVTRFGAAGDGVADCTAAFRKAVAACHEAGGGRVVVPGGTFLTGAIHLLSNVNLHVTSQATVKFSRDTAKYLPLVFTRWEGIELMNYSPFIYAFEQENVAITGRGVLDGQSDCEHWWPWKGRTDCGWKKGDPDQSQARARLFEMAEQAVPVSERLFGEGHYLRPMFIQPYRCKNVLIEGVTLKGSPMWQIHPVLCTNVTVRHMTITGSGPNTDGCDPESCADVLIKNCYFDTGDDCIAINSGRNADGRRLHVPAENIVIQDCRMKGGHGAVTVGSQISGGARNIFAENCEMLGPDLDVALRIKNNALRGGLLENIYARNFTVGQVAQAVISIDFYYEEGEAGKFTPVVRNVQVRNLRSAKADRALYLRGFPRAPITDLILEDCDFEGVAKPNLIENVRGVTLRHVRINGDPLKQLG